jgi:hypothetical protein
MHLVKSESDMIKSCSKICSAILQVMKVLLILTYMASSKFKHISLINFLYTVLIDMIWFFFNASLMITIQGHGEWHLISFWLYIKFIWITIQDEQCVNLFGLTSVWSGLLWWTCRILHPRGFRDLQRKLIVKTLNLA